MQNYLQPYCLSRTQVEKLKNQILILLNGIGQSLHLHPEGVDASPDSSSFLTIDTTELLNSPSDM